MFLKNPQDIRRAVQDLADHGQAMQLAVAFVGRDWQDIIPTIPANSRVVCWLSSTNTNPYAVSQLIKSTAVKQRDSMHAKVYLVAGVGAVVGSANLSHSALEDDENAGQIETAMFVSDPKELNRISDWFEALWENRKTSEISEDDLKRAILAYERRPKRSGKKHYKKPKLSKVSGKTLSDLAPFLHIARQVGTLDTFIDASNDTRSITPERATRTDVKQLYDHLVGWAGHAGIYKKLLDQHQVSEWRSGLSLLFDESVPPSERLETILAEEWLSPLQVPSLSMLMHWRQPAKYPPHNQRTKRFLDDFGLNRTGVSSSSPRCYERWLEYAADLSQQFELPSRGHVDRVVWEYTNHDDNWDSRRLFLSPGLWIDWEEDGYSIDHISPSVFKKRPAKLEHLMYTDSSAPRTATARCKARYDGRTMILSYGKDPDGIFLEGEMRIRFSQSKDQVEDIVWGGDFEPYAWKYILP